MSADGWVLGLTARRINLLEELQESLPELSYIRYMDVSQTDDARHALRSMIQEMEGVDMIIYNSGVGHDFPDWKIERQIVQVNVLGFTVIAKTAYDYFKEKGSGQIVGISSVAGTRGMGPGTAYAASKAFMSHYMRGLRHKIKRKGRKIHVTDIRPGFIRTEMTAEIEGKMFWVVDVDRCARDTWRAIKRKKQTAFVPARWRLVYWVMRLVPDFIWNRL